MSETDTVTNAVNEWLKMFDVAKTMAETDEFYGLMLATADESAELALLAVHGDPTTEKILWSVGNALNAVCFRFEEAGAPFSATEAACFNSLLLGRVIQALRNE